MRLRLLLLPALCLLAACAKTLDDRVTRAQWYSPASVPTYQKLAPEQRIAFTIYRNHIVRLNFGRADGLPEDVTWNEAIARGNALRAREQDAIAALRSTLADASIRVTDVRIGRSNAVCGRIVFPRGHRYYERSFIVMPDNAVEASPSREEFEADEKDALERWRNVGALLRECEADTSALPRSSLQPTVEAADLIAAAQAGERGDVGALRGIVERQSDALLNNYAQAFQGQGGRATPDMEAILLVAAGQSHRPATWPLVLPSWPRCTTRYKDPAMRAALLDRATTNPDGLGASQLLCASFDVDGDAIDMLARVRAYYVTDALIGFVRERRLPDAVPVLVAFLSDLADQREWIRPVAHAHVALARIGTDASLSAFRTRVATLTAQRDDLASQQALYFLDALAEIERDPRVDVGAIVPLWAAYPQRETRAAFAKWTTSWNVKEAVPLLQRSLEDRGEPYLVPAILRLGTPADWKRLDTWLRDTEPGRAISPDLRRQVEAAVADPQRAAAKQANRGPVVR